MKNIKTKNFNLMSIVNFNFYGAVRLGQLLDQDEFYSTVKLLKPVELSTLKYNPYEKNHRDYDTLEDKTFLFRNVRIKTRKINFTYLGTNRFLNAKTDGERFKLLLRGLWGNFKINKIKSINPKGKPLFHKYWYDKWMRSDIVDEEKKDDGALYFKYYHSYFGFTNNNIYFNNKGYHELDFTYLYTSYFGNIGNFTSGATPLKKDDYICGITSKRDDGKICYDKWFVCSKKFYNFWKFIMSNDNYTKEQIQKLTEHTWKEDISDFDYFEYHDENPYHTMINFIFDNYQNEDDYELIHNIIGI